jgi:hypothetical protein
VDPEATFLAGYAVGLVVVAAILERLGRRPTDPWSSKMLAASRPPDPHPPDEARWPHSEVPVLHLGVSAVALAAALLLTLVSLARHHAPVELVLQLAVLALIALRIVRLARARLSSMPGSSPPASPPSSRTPWP